MPNSDVEVRDQGRQLLSPGQERMWLIDQLEGPSSLYNQPMVFHLRGPLDVASLVQALQQIVKRHEILRTRITTVHGSPVQQVENIAFDVSQLDISMHGSDQRLHLLNEQILLDATAVFHLDDVLKLRATLVKLESAGTHSHHVLLVAIHHIATDGWSMGIFRRELSAFYNSFCTGKANPYTEPPFQYAEYAQWQRKWLAAEQTREQIAYWQKAMAGAPALLEMPTDFPRPAVQKFRGKIHIFRINEDTKYNIKQLSSSESVTQFMTLLAVFNVLLSRYSGQDDIVVGTPIANRSRVEHESSIGYFANTLLLRADLSGSPTFRSLLKRIRGTALEAYQYQDVPFEKLVETLKPDRTLSYSALFQVMFILRNTPSNELTLHNLDIEKLESSEGDELISARFDLTLSLVNTVDGINARIVYNADLFRPATIDRLAAHFQTLLGGILANPDQVVSQLPILSASERHQILYEWNPPSSTLASTLCIHQLIECNAARTPNAIAIEFEEKQLSYDELNVRSNQLAHYLINQGVKAETIIGICLQRSIETIVATLAVLKAGGAYVQIDSRWPAQRIANVLHDCDAPIVLTQSSLLDNFNKVDEHFICNIYCMDVNNYRRLGELSDENPVTDVAMHNLAYVLYTSGSTGKPKGVMIEHAQLVQYTLSIIDRCKFDSSMVYAQLQSFYFDSSYTMLYSALATGATLHVIPSDLSLNAVALSHYVKQHSIDCMKLTPSHMSVLLEEKVMPRKRLILGGEAVRRSLVDGLDAGPECRLFNHYGPTETTIGVTTHQVGSVIPASVNTDESLVPIGRPLDKTQIYILNEHSEPVPIAVAGELYIGGSLLARGYLNLPELTNSCFVVSPFDPDKRLYKTGDKARYLHNGEIEFLGRLDNQLKIRGYRIEPIEIEQALLDEITVQDVVVTGCEDEHGQTELAAYVVLTKEQQDVTSAVGDLRECLKSKLPEYMRPTIWATMDAMPLNANGKLDRKALAIVGIKQKQNTPFSAPVTDTQTKLAQIWSSLLGVDQIGLHDNFFELGGHSLNATQVVARIRQQMLMDVPLRWLFENPILQELSARIEVASAENAPESGYPLTPRSSDDALMLSYAQERLWFLDQMEGATAQYNIPFSLRLAGMLDVSAIERALQDIVVRHDILRTAIVQKNDGLPQLKASDTSLELHRRTLTGSFDNCKKSLDKLLVEEKNRPFDLSADLKIRATLVFIDCGMSTDQYALMVTFHHIAADGWSLRIFQRELSVLYNDYCEKRTATLQTLPVRFSDYAIWQRKWLEGQRLLEQISYWKKQLAGAPALLEIPTDHVRPAIQKITGKVHSFTLSRVITEKIKLLGVQHEVTLYMSLLAAFNLLLCRYSGQHDIIIGSPVANRTQVEAEGLIGCFVNSLVMRTDLSGDISFIELLNRVRETTISAYQYQDLPFEKLVEVLQPPRSLSYSPLFQVMFVLHNTPEATISLNGLEVERLDLSSLRTITNAKSDLALSVLEHSGELRCKLNYRADLFDTATIERMAGHLKALLGGIIATPSMLIAKLPLLTADESYQLKEWNETDVAIPEKMCIHQFVEEQVERTPNEIAVQFEDELLTYQELNVRANRLAHWLVAKGVKPDSLVGICMHRCLDMSICLLAILKSGGAFVPIDPDYPAERINHVLGDAAPIIVITHEKLQNIFVKFRSTIVLYDKKWEPESPQSDLNIDTETLALHSRNLAYVMYTSGSTGTPKGVMNEHRSVVNYILFRQRAFGLDGSGRVLQKTPFIFDTSVWEYFWPLFVGARVVIARPDGHQDPVYLCDMIRTCRVTTIDFVPSMLRVFLDETNIDPQHNLQHISSGGEELKIDLQQKCLSKLPHCELHNMYGPTEAAIASTTEQCRIDHTATIGRPIANAKIYILDPHDQLLPIGIPGEICIGGIGVARGYLNNAKLTTKHFVVDPFGSDDTLRMYKTGDFGVRLADGRINYIGRNDSQVKLRGFRIELGEIESVLSQHSAVIDVAVSIENSTSNTSLVAYVATEKKLDEQELKSYVSNYLPEYMVPAFYISLEKLPRTVGGKIDRNALPALGAERIISSVYMAPTNSTESRLVEIWSNLLGIDEVGITDNFFDLGGHSLKAIQVLSRVQDSFSLVLSLRSIFEYTTIREYAQMVDNLIWINDESGDQFEGSHEI